MNAIVRAAGPESFLGLVLIEVGLNADVLKQKAIRNGGAQHGNHRGKFGYVRSRRQGDLHIADARNNILRNGASLRTRARNCGPDVALRRLRQNQGYWTAGLDGGILYSRTCPGIRTDSNSHARRIINRRCCVHCRLRVGGGGRLAAGNQQEINGGGSCRWADRKT